ncbi:type II secretion system F family protein [soil metagenome]
MTIALGLLLGLGLVLAVSPFLWPAAAASAAPPLVRRVRDRLVQAGLGRVSVTTFAVASMIVGCAAGALVFAVLPVGVVAVAAGVLGLAVPSMLVVARARSQRKATRVVWPDVVDHLISGVRSGLALPDSIVTLAHTGPPATRVAFEAFESEYRASGNFSSSIDRLKDRLADPVADRILETLRMSREVGGSELVQVLRNLASYLRQEASLRSEVEARQSWVVVAARLGVAAPWIVLALLATRPEAALAYNSVLGGVIIVAGLVLSVIAYRIMLALGRLPEERRWFQ